MAKRIKHKAIRLYPTTFELNVFLYGESLADLEKSLSKRWPKTEFSCYVSDIKEHEVAFVDTINTDKYKTIIMIIRDPDLATIVHECHHVLMRLSEIVGIEVGIDAQEWGAYFTEYLFEEIKAMLK